MLQNTNKEHHYLILNCLNDVNLDILKTRCKLIKNKTTILLIRDYKAINRIGILKQVSTLCTCIFAVDSLLDLDNFLKYKSIDFKFHKINLHIKQSFLQELYALPFRYKLAILKFAKTTSIHNSHELVIAQRHNIKKAFVSPVFTTISDGRIKAGIGYLHFYKIAKLNAKCNIDSIALGGLNQERFNKMKKFNTNLPINSYGLSYRPASSKDRKSSL